MSYMAMYLTCCRFGTSLAQLPFPVWNKENYHMLLNLKKPAEYEDFREMQLLDANDQQEEATVARSKAGTAKTEEGSGSASSMGKMLWTLSH